MDDHLTDLQKTILQSLNNYFNLKLNVDSDDEISHLKEILPNCEYINDVQWLFNLVDIRDLVYLKYIYTRTKIFRLHRKYIFWCILYVRNTVVILELMKGHKNEIIIVYDIFLWKSIKKYYIFLYSNYLSLILFIQNSKLRF